MKAIVNTGPHRLEMLDYPLPQPGPGQVRIRTGACGICATDLEMIAGWDRTGFPATPGHEWAGTVDAAGAAVDAALVGRRCVAENVWADGGEVGFEHPGGYGQYLLTEAANVQVLPDDFLLTSAALIEPLAVCVRGLRRLQAASGGHVAGPVLVFGDGPIGLLMTALLARDSAADVTLMGGRDQRLALAREFGAQQTLNYHSFSGDLVAAMRSSASATFPTIIEATGSANAAVASLQLVDREGVLLVLGDYGHSQANFPWNHLLHREITLLGSNASAGAWPEAVRLAVNGEAPLHRLITHRLPAEQFQQGIDMTRSRRGDVVKVVLEWM